MEWNGGRMSILVKGMDMPRCCFECKLPKAGLCSVFAGAWFEPKMLQKLKERRHSECPIEEIK